MYNKAVCYLKEKLGTKEVRSGYGTKNSPHRVDTVYLAENILQGTNEELVHTLLKQYYNGVEAQKELSNLLTNLGVV
jgi:hypothetical protein